eukprot:822452-Pyramimonas_sp.AAC.1
MLGWGSPGRRGETIIPDQLFPKLGAGLVQALPEPMKHRAQLRAAQGAEEVRQDVPVLGSTNPGPRGLANEPSDTAISHGVSLEDAVAASGAPKQARRSRPRPSPQARLWDLKTAARRK